jgi:hypothetical protein
MHAKLTAILVTFLSLIQTFPAAQAQVPEDSLRAATRESYIFTYPLVMMYRTMYLQAIDENSPSFSGGMG